MMGVKTLFETLKPEFFDNFVSATKIISGYDPSSRTFSAASVAAHMGTTLKQVCDIATKMIIKKNAEMEQFATFMSHTKKNTKVSKLLLAINKGDGTKYKGKSLEEIELSENDEAEESDVDEEKNPDNLHHSPSSFNSNDHYTSGFGPCNNDNENRRVMTTKLKKRKKQNNETSNSSSDNVHENVNKQKKHAKKIKQ
ncbi:hypothetical protein RN001_008826 [Aquatica leii]|uniref:Uncharacterized protein n=1 Tax=Aquatica leii TaxID=1421715 RepID=A0AAN7SRI1_9COLE|nr:hypothetical protein RN001_008826 [Aquatica leii]